MDDIGDSTLAQRNSNANAQCEWALMLTLTKIETCSIFFSERCRYADADAWCEWTLTVNSFGFTTPVILLIGPWSAI